MEMDRSTKLNHRTRRRATAGYAPPKSVSHYDDVFSSPALLSPSEEIYREIFAGFHGGARGGGRASAIPFLDLPPPVDETETLFDLRFFDYSEVFGRFEGTDYAIPFHELFRQSNGGHASPSEGAWTPVETESLSEEWDGSSCSSRRKSFGNESSQQSVDDGKQFIMSFQRKHQLKEGVLNTAHLAPVHPVPAYVVVTDQISPSQKIEFQNLHLAADADNGRLFKRGSSDEDKAVVPNGSDEMYVTISEINLRTQPNDVPPPSRPPPICDARYGITSQATSSIRATCSSKHFSRSLAGDDSPPCVDVEVDGSFSDSDPSMKESVNNYQATAKTIKENFQNKNVCVKDENERNAAVRKSHNSFGIIQHPSKKEGSWTSNSDQSSPDAVRRNLILSASDKRRNKQTWLLEESSDSHSSGEWSEAPEFIDLVRSEKTKTHKQGNGETILVHSGTIEGGKEGRRMSEYENKRVSITSNKSEDHVKRSEAIREVATQAEKCKEVLVPRQTKDMCKEVGRNAYEENQQLDGDIFIDIMTYEREIKESNKIKQKMKFDEGRTEDARLHLEEIPKDSFAATEDDQIIRKTCEIELINCNQKAQSTVRKDTQIKQHHERVMNIDTEEAQEPCFKEALENEENFKNQETSDEKDQTKKQLNETKRQSRETSGKEESDRREKEEEFVAKLMEASENEAEDMLKEALEEVNKRIIMEEIERVERDKEMENDAERPQFQESLAELSQSKDMMFEHTDEKEPTAIKKMHRDPNMMTVSQGSSLLTPDANISTEAKDHRRCKTEIIKEETVERINSVCDSNQDDVGSAQEVIIVPGKNSKYRQISVEGRTNAEYTVGADTHELHSAAQESIVLPNRTSMSSNSSGEASLYEYQIGVKMNHKVPHMPRDLKNHLEKLQVGKVTMLENAHAQANADSLCEVGISKDKFARNTDRNTANNKSSVSDGRKETYSLSQQNKTSQIVGGKENCRNDGSALEERAKLERERRAREIELEHLREMEEEWEREREREKDRVAFESVTRNVREGSYAGLRERASVNKVAVARACQKDLGNALESSEKSCLDADEKSYSDKIYMEAKMRQDQSAVKRAVAEAQEFSTANYPSVSTYNDGLEGESARRCKARLERQQRTAERAAKALAEKNTRDVIAQREQAERHRLAELLDVEVKRWAHGKHGNLRALLSTLQYILGADSGWMPVPLTEIITSAAVKKAYRKATLCVHPDKLQQRRATIQQKYVCEKVFDLLKEAWNRFNSEER